MISSNMPSLVATGLTGLRSGLKQVDRNASAIAQAATSTSPQQTLTQNLVQMQAASQQVQASAAVVRTADQTLGLLVNTHA